MRWVKQRAASWSLFRFLSNRPLWRRYFCFSISNGIIGASSLPSLVKISLPSSMNPMSWRVDSNTFSAVRIFLLFKFAYAQHIVILIIKSMNKGCFLFENYGSIGTRILLYPLSASLSSLSIICQLISLVSLIFFGVYLSSLYLHIAY